MYLLSKMAAPCMAAATSAPDSDVCFLSNILSVPLQTCTRIASNSSSLHGLRNSNFAKNLFGVNLVVELETLSEQGILHREDQGACKAADSPPTTSRHWRWRKRCERPSTCRKRCARRSKRGKRAGISARLKANPYRPALLSILLSNVRSLENKMDYLKLDLTTQRKVPSSSLRRGLTTPFRTAPFRWTD